MFLFIKPVLVFCAVAISIAFLADLSFELASYRLGGFAIIASQRGWLALFATGWIVAFAIGWVIVKKMHLLLG
jgi:hypothetical protein